MPLRRWLRRAWRHFALAFAFSTVSLAAAAQEGVRPEPSIPSVSDYHAPLEEIIVRGGKPYWRKPPANNWQRPGLTLPKSSTSRLQFAPRYTHEERDDAPGHDTLNLQPRAKLFELKF